MSRRYVKNAIFLLLFASLTIAVYTLFLGSKKGVERSDWKGLVQNMAVGHVGRKPETDKVVGESDSDINQDGHRENANENKNHWGNKHFQEHDLELDNHRPDGENDEQKESHLEDVEDVNKNDPFTNEPDEEELSETIEEDNEELEDPDNPDLNPEDVKLRDKEGKLVGYKLFPNGLHPDHAKPPEQRLRDLRIRLGLPPVAAKKERVPRTTEAPPGAPRRIINAGGNVADPKKVVYNLGAFRLKGRDDEPWNLPGQVDLNNKLDDRFENVRKRPQDFRLRGRDHDQAARPNGNVDGLIQPANNERIAQARPFNVNNNLMPGQSGQRHEVNGKINGILPPNNVNRFPNQRNIKGGKAVIIRPIGKNGVNPFHTRQNADHDVMPNEMPANRLRGMNPYARNDKGINEDLLQNTPINNNRVNPFQLNRERADHELVRNPVPTGQGTNPLARNHQGIREDLLQEEADNEMHPLAPKGQILNRGDNSQHGLPHGNILDDTQGVKGGDAVPSRDIKNDEIPDSVQGEVLEGGKQELETPLHIEDVNKPLPIDLDCVPFIFPTKRGTLCVHDSDHDKAMSGVIKRSGIWEPDMLAEFFLILKSHPELGVVDIGAGIGVYTITAALMDRQVVAVEPLNKNCRLLHKSALENKVSSKITLVTHAIGSESYSGYLHYDDDSGGYSQARVERISEETADTDPSNIVQVTTLNNLVQALPFGSAVVKIDVGGFMESEVLRSSSKFFKALKVPYILTHWDFHTGLTKKIEVITLLSQLGYRPRLQWDGSDANPEILKKDIHFLVWAL